MPGLPPIPDQFVMVKMPGHQLPTELVLGTTPDDKLYTVDDEARARHTYIMGTSGSGKTRFLASLMLQDMSYGRPLAVLDPVGHLYRYALNYTALCCDDLEWSGYAEAVPEVQRRFLFLDVGDPLNPLRVNPLAPSDTEDSERLVDDLLKAFDRVFGDLTRTRRLRGSIRTTLLMIAELNKLPANRRPQLPDGFTYPLNLSFAMRFLNSKPEDRRPFIEAIPVPLTQSPEYFVSEFLQYLSTHRDLPEITESSMNILAFFGDSMVQNFFGTQESTLDIHSLIDKDISIFCRIPTSTTLSGAQLVGTYISTVFSRSAMRRPSVSNPKPYSLMADEFHHFCDETFAADAVELRNHGIRLITAHQTMSQPPFTTEFGRNVLGAIQGNSDLKILFTLDRADAEDMSKRVFELTQNKLKMIVQERSWGSSDTSGSDTSHQDVIQWGESSSLTWNWNKPSEDSRWTDGYQTRSGFSSGSRQSYSSGTTESTHERKVYYTQDEEREQTVNLLQKLGKRQFVVSAGPLSALEGRTLPVPDYEELLPRTGVDNLLLELQRQRFSPPKPPSTTAQSSKKPPKQGRFSW